MIFVSRCFAGDVLVRVNTQLVLGFTHQDVVAIFQSIPVGDRVRLDICRGYSLPFDLNDPNTEIVTTVAVSAPPPSVTSNNSTYSAGHNISRTNNVLNSSQRSIKSLPDLASYSKPNMQQENGQEESDHSSDMHGGVPSISKPELLTMNIVKGAMGFGFTIADSAYGQKVKQILDKPRCKTLQEGDILVEINKVLVKDMNHAEVVLVLKDCPRGQETGIIVQRGGILTPSKGRRAVLKSVSKKRFVIIFCS